MCIFLVLKKFSSTYFINCVQKVGEEITKLEIVKEVLASIGDIAKTANFMAAGIDEVALKVYYIPNQHHEFGKTSADFDGTTLSIYDRERTICDCFKYRTKLDSELFNKAILAYVADKQKNLQNLSKYGKEMGLFKRINDLMEVMLNG